MAIITRREGGSMDFNGTTFYFKWDKVANQWEAYCYASDHSHHIFALTLAHLFIHIRARPDDWVMPCTTATMI